MDNEDLLAVLAVLKAELIRIGAPEIAEDSAYTRPNPETGEIEFLSPLHRVKEMLQAFERFLAINDVATYRDAMTRLESSMERPPRGAVVVTLGAPSGGVTEIELGQAPELGEVRRGVGQLIGQIGESYRG